MSCEYCKNKQKNTPIVKTDDLTEGVSAKVVRSDDTAFLSVFAWYDGWGDGAIGIEPELRHINYCPMCGAKVCD